MHRMLFLALLTTLVYHSSIAFAQPIMSSPSGERYVKRNVDGETILPNGRLITPTGAMHAVRPHPYGLTSSPDGRWVVAVSSDGPQLSILDMADPQAPVISYIPENMSEGKGVLDAAFMGLAISADSKTLYVAGGRSWKVYVFDLATREKLFEIDCAHRVGEADYGVGYLGDIRLRSDGKYIYGVDQLHFRMVTIDVEARKVVGSVGVGRYPFGIALSPDEREAYVANVGMYEYAYFRKENGKRTWLPFPPFGVPSEAAEKGTTVDGVVAPALGDPNDLQAMSVWSVALTEEGAGNVRGRYKTGHLVGEQLEDFPAVGGSSPNSMVATGDHVYVSNGSNDSITVINTATGKREADIDLVLDGRVTKCRGMIPFGLALSPDGSTLYVAEAGINAIGVIRLSDRKVLGHIPTAWFPSKLALSPDGRTLYAACAKGIGSGPSGGPNHNPSDPTGIGALMRGYINVIPIPGDEKAMAAATAQVLQNNVRFDAPEMQRAKEHPIPAPSGAWKSPIKHVIYVTKENRTYDEIFGALPGGRGDSEICRLGKPIDVSNKDGSRTIKDVLLMPNHIALAKRFAINDNFYCDSDHSIDGHRWLVGTYPNEFMEVRIGESSPGKGPGDFAFIGSSGTIYPEDYNEGGAIWAHFERNGVSFYNFGLGFEFHPQTETQKDKYTGIRLTINYPMPQVLFERTSRKFATYNTNIPDQFRMDMFEEEYNEKWVSGKEPFPQFISVMLPNDHGSGERPDDGYPFWGSYMSDNDLALGRLVELISHSPWWKETVIMVTEDDAQGYVDSVDAHRSICMVISPYAKQDYVSHTHTSIGSMLKTAFSIFGLLPLNQYDAFASDLGDMFTATPDNAAPYNALPVNPEIFDPQKAFDPFDREFNWEALNDFVPMDDQAFLDRDEYGHAGKKSHAPREAE
jgi:YVTN family beta-propeller protein